MEDKLKDIKDRIAPSYYAGINIGEGWYPLVLKLHQDLLEIDPNYKVLQVKEKFGGLRYYVECDPELSDEQYAQCRELIVRAEEDSFSICEETGGPGVLMKNERGWIKTLDPDKASSEWTVVKEWNRNL